MNFAKFVVWVTLVIVQENFNVVKSIHEQIEKEAKWFEQYLDHFNVWDNRTFYMRYYEFDEFFKPGGPLILRIGEETSVDPDGIIFSSSYNLTRKLGGQLILLEHRYYGESLPFENATKDDLIYLTTEQALEDLAYFIDSYKKITPGLEKSKVAVFGCSYGGALATWLRYKFPHLVDAAWASSAPLHHTLDFYQYYEVAGEMYANVSSECIAIIRQGYREAIEILSTPEGLEKYRPVFSEWECENVTDKSAEYILADIRSIVSNQYNQPGYDVESCKFLQSKKQSTTCFEQLAAFVVNNSGEVCFDEEENNDISWDYQTCTEFPYCFTTSSPKQPFRDDYSAIDEHVKFCSEWLGDKLTREGLQRSVDRLNRVYGSTDLKITRVLSVHGSHDPWHRLGLYFQKDKDAPVLLIPKTSHCADENKFPDGEAEPVDLINAKREAMRIMTKWLK